MALKLYPLGIQTFERIRKENKLYIDKTEYVYRLTHTSGTYFSWDVHAALENPCFSPPSRVTLKARKTYSMVLPSKSWKRSGQNILCSTLI